MSGNSTTHPSAYPEPAIARQAFLDSECANWADFCVKMDWSDNATRRQYPISKWTLEKRRIIAEKHAEHIRETVFDYRIQYRKDVLATLRDYPATSDMIHTLIRRKLNQLVDQLEKNPTGFQTIMFKNKPYQIPVLDTEELVKLSMAIKTITDAKHKSLLLDSVVARVAEQAPAEVAVEDGAEEAKKSQGFLIEVLGLGEVSLKDLQRLSQEYIDPPQTPALPALASLEASKTEADPLADLIKEDPPLVETDR